MLNSLINFFLLINKKTGKPSYSTTMVVFGFFIINLKLLFSGITYKGIKCSDFSGVDYSACLAAISGLHIGNKIVNKKSTDKEAQE
jgi:hypothetical protein